MNKTRVEAFSDGVIAIIITIMVLEIKVPSGADWAAVYHLLPSLLSYALSFVFVGIYWNNHHHLFHAVECINGKILWANMHLLFWLSLLPILTEWMASHHFNSVSVACYGVVLFLCGFAYFILTNTLVSYHTKDSVLVKAIGNELKEKLSIAIYATAVPLAFINSWIAYGLYIVVALMWLVPDQRIEQTISK